MRYPLLLALCSTFVTLADTRAQARIAEQPKDAASLVHALGRDRGRLPAMRALVTMGKDAVPELERTIENANAGKITPALPHVFRCLAAIGPDAVTAQPLLRTYLKEGATDHLLAAMCAYADLAAYAPHMEQVAPNRYYDDTTLLNHARLRLPREFATDAGRKLAVVARTQEIKVNQRVRVFAEHANPNDVATLVAIVQRDLWFQREVAAEQLGRMGPDAKQALTPLAVALGNIHDPDAGMPDRIGGKNVLLRDDFGARAAEAILRIDAESPCAAEARAFVVGNSDDPTARMDALAHLAGKPGDADRVTRILAGWLAQKPVHAEVFNALGAIGARAHTAIPSLEAIAASGRAPEARLAELALRQIRPK